MSTWTTITYVHAYHVLPHICPHVLLGKLRVCTFFGTRTCGLHDEGFFAHAPVVSMMKAEIGGWWLICSMHILVPSSMRACQVSPRMGLKGFIHRSNAMWMPVVCVYVCVSICVCAHACVCLCVLVYACLRICV
jgi:hypothetical protein